MLWERASREIDRLRDGRVETAVPTSAQLERERGTERQATREPKSRLALHARSLRCENGEGKLTSEGEAPPVPDATRYRLSLRGTIKNMRCNARGIITNRAGNTRRRGRTRKRIHGMRSGCACVAPVQASIAGMSAKSLPKLRRTQSVSTRRTGSIPSARRT